MDQANQKNQVKLIRINQSEELGTHGVLIDRYSHEEKAGVPFALTLEPPWRNNEPYESCIPTGVYECKAVNSPRFGSCYEIEGVPNRDHVLFHKGNFTKDTSGCVLVGERFEVVGDCESAVASSGDGFNEFMRRMGGNKFYLAVSNGF